MSEIYVLEPSTSGKVIIHTTHGSLDVELWSKECPKACRNFLQLCADGYYDNCTFHRIIPDFLVQTGDPTGTGQGGESIYANPSDFTAEYHPRLKFRYRGMIGLAAYTEEAGDLKKPANDAKRPRFGSQFFVTLTRDDSLSGRHPLFGKVTGVSLYNLLEIANCPVDRKTGRPLEPMPRIRSTDIVFSPFDDIQPRASLPPAQRPSNNASSQAPVVSTTQRRGTRNIRIRMPGANIERRPRDGGLQSRMKRSLLSFGDVEASLDDNKVEPEAVEEQGDIEVNETSAVATPGGLANMSKGCSDTSSNRNVATGVSAPFSLPREQPVTDDRAAALARLKARILQTAPDSRSGSVICSPASNRPSAKLTADEPSSYDPESQSDTSSAGCSDSDNPSPSATQTSYLGSTVSPTTSQVDSSTNIASVTADHDMAGSSSTSTEQQPSRADRNQRPPGAVEKLRFKPQALESVARLVARTKVIPERDIGDSGVMAGSSQPPMERTIHAGKKVEDDETSSSAKSLLFTASSLAVQTKLERRRAAAALEEFHQTKRRLEQFIGGVPASSCKPDTDPTSVAHGDPEPSKGTNSSPKNEEDEACLNDPSWWLQGMGLKFARDIYATDAVETRSRKPVARGAN